MTDDPEMSSLARQLFGRPVRNLTGVSNETPVADATPDDRDPLEDFARNLFETAKNEDEDRPLTRALNTQLSDKENSL